MPDIRIVLFEDTEATRSEVLEALKKHLAGDGSVIPFVTGTVGESSLDKERTYEARIEAILAKEPYDQATLIVADRDLSKSKDLDFTGLSVSAVAAASRKLGIPVCSYARQPALDDQTWRGHWEEGHIFLDFSAGADELARRAVIAARGFSTIASGIKSIIEESRKNSPAKLLATLLAKPEYADKMALYGVGDQSRLSEIPARVESGRVGTRMMARFLGYWLWDSLLRYPGVFVNEIAAASYLNINTDDYADPQVQAIFDGALYRGPFADMKRPQWWRGLLDDIISGEGGADGLEVVRAKVRPAIAASQCCVDPSKTAGYYCIISRAPVSLENSKGGLSWFPRGADLTRISIPKFEEYGPWIGA